MMTTFVEETDYSNLNIFHKIRLDSLIIKRSKREYWENKKEETIGILKKREYNQELFYILTPAIAYRQSHPQKKLKKQCKRVYKVT